MQQPRAWDLGRCEGWRAYVLSERRERPDVLTVVEIKSLSESARADFNDRRLDFHANFGTIHTPQLLAAHELFDLVIDTGLRVDSDRVKPSVVLDAAAGVGKTTTVNEYLRDFERRELLRYGDRTEAGDLRIPVCRIGMTAKSGLKPLTGIFHRFYAGPSVEGRSYGRSELYEIILEYVFRCETRIIFVDDVHFLNPASKDGLTVSNFFKGWTNDMPVALIMAGVNLSERGLYTEGKAINTGIAQNSRRWTPISVSTYANSLKKDKNDWRDLLGAYEQQLVLACAEPGDLVANADLIFDRTQGYLVSVNHLITRAAAVAIRRGTERITNDIISAVPLDYSAEQYWEMRSQNNVKPSPLPDTKAS